MDPRRTLPVGLATLTGALALTTGASAATRETVRAADAQVRACHARYVGGSARGVDVVRYTAAARGLVRVRLAGRGDWDLGVFDARTKRSVAGSAGPASNELAEGFAHKGQHLLVQACRFRGAAGRATVTADTLALATNRERGDRTQLVAVKADQQRLVALGLDVTEHGSGGRAEVVAHGRADLRTLRAAGLAYRVVVADLDARARAARRADARYAKRARTSARAAQAAAQLPSGRTEYRRLPDYELELKQLAMRYPALAKPITLSRRTLEGRDIVGLEITRSPNALDGKPVFLNMGTHHAREWPSAEHAMEFAYDLLTSYGRSSRATDLVDATRTIVVPVVNPDGFNVSREAQSVPPEDQFSPYDLEYRRKNCRIRDGSPGTEDCSALLRTVGVDLNRNYGGFWGGPGASPNPRSDTYRGEGPFSEPETQAVRELLSTRNVTNLITNHTYANLVLRPPGVASVGFPVDEPRYRALGASFAAANGYANIPSFGLYDTTGATEDWSYWSQGSLGFTFEIGTEGFHPPFERGVVAEYLGRAPAAGAGRGGNREAFYRMLEATRDRAYHAVIRGQAPAGSALTLEKAFETQTSPVLQSDGTTTDPLTFPDRLSYAFQTTRRRFRLDVNPSTRPVVAGRYGRVPQGPAQPAIELANPPGVPAENRTGPEVQPYEELSFEVGALPQYDNGRVTVHIEWTSPETDWDIYVYDAYGNQVASSASGATREENATILFPDPGRYTVRVVNYDQASDTAVDDWRGGRVEFAQPTPPVPGVKESWTLSCRRPDGRPTASRQVQVDRGERVDVGAACRVTD
jgi:hypothetical protein